MASMREAKRCDGTRKGHVCGGQVFKCGNPECRSEGCEKSGCTSRQFEPIQKCKDCGRAYDRIQQFEVARAVVEEGAASSNQGVRVAMPRVEIIFGGVLGFIALAAALAAVLGVFDGSGGLTGGAVAPPSIAVVQAEAAEEALTDICQCYRGGMALAGTGASVLSPSYRSGFVQCRAVFGAQGGDAWTAGWNARLEGRLVAAGCRSWLRGVGR